MSVQTSRPASLLPLAGAAIALSGLTAWVVVTLGEPLLWAVPAVMAAATALALARPSPLAWLGLVLGLQVFQLGGEQGTSALEAIAGLALVGYIGMWYGLTWISGRRVVTSLFDVAAVTWGTVGLVVAAVLGQIFGADAYDFRADLLATLPFLLYLPVKDACARHRHGSLVVASVLALFALTATLQNGMGFYRLISGQSEWYEIADARFIVGETSMTAGVMLALAGAATLRSARARLGLIALAGLFLAGLVLTKSRGFWVSNVFGIGLTVLVAPPETRRKLIAFGSAGLVLVAVLALTFFGEQINLIVVGTLRRLLSLTGASSDISLLNRYAESAATWEKIRLNPVLGYGWGVQVTHYSIIGQATRHWAFLHNGYLALWLKTGLWGLLLMLSVWAGGFARGIRAVRSPHLEPVPRAAGLAMAGTLGALALVAITSNPFSVFDQMLVVTLVLGLAHGTGERARLLRPDARLRCEASL